MSTPSLDSTRLRRSPHLVCYWQGRRFILHNYATNVSARGSSLTREILDFFGEWRSAEALFDASAHLPRTSVRTLLRVLVDRSFLQREDRPMSVEERAMGRWAPWNPSAGLFHSATKDVPFVDVTPGRFPDHAARTGRMPDPVKRYAGASLFPLPASPNHGEFPGVLLGRRTWRRFSNRPIDLSAFGTLLGLTAGIQRWVITKDEGKVALKTSPSGGARHALELYTLVLRIDGLPRGLYHYAADAHALELLDSNVDARLVTRYLPTQWWYTPASALVIFAASFPRELWRYDYARAYRAVLIEAGHLCQTFCLTATWLGLAPFCSMALADSRIEQDLKLDGITESVLYAAGVGTRPSRVDWTPPPAIGARPRLLTRREARQFPGRIVRPPRSRSTS